MSKETDKKAIWVDDSKEILSYGFLEHFRALQDPRLLARTSHNLFEVIFIAVCGYICGANSWAGIHEFALERERWLRQWLELKNGLPSCVTYWRVLSQLNPSAFQACFRSWADSLLGENKHIAIDGKQLRGVHDPNNSKASLILVSAWATECSLLLGQVKTDVKSNEITAIPKLLEMVCVKNCLVSIDAIGCQVEIAKKITGLGGDYLLALKGNQGTLEKDVALYFDDALKSDWKGINYEGTSSTEKGHGRIEERKAFLIKKINWLTQRSSWSKIKGIILITSARTIKGKTTEEKRYFITSASLNIEELALAVRRHWGIENGLHWCLDVGFREDRQVAQKTNLAENLAVLRRIAFNYLRQEKSNLSIENKRLKAAMSTTYLEHILGASAKILMK